jgi:hypothetical protein
MQRAGWRTWSSGCSVESSNRPAGVKVIGADAIAACATIKRMPNYLDFLVVFDDHIRQSSLAYVTYGSELDGLAASGLVSTDDTYIAPRWVGELVAAGYMTHGPLAAGDRQPLPVGAFTSQDLSRVSDYRVTAAGREEADRVRRQRREDLTDIALGGAVARLLHAPMGDEQRAAIMVSATNLRAALDNEHHAAAVGAAKDLVEAACRSRSRAPARALRTGRRWWRFSSRLSPLVVLTVSVTNSAAASPRASSG